ncbi:hypothetical protein [Micromonospora parathelypteridis]|uniref:Lipoprotein n=1 Tax=Micromonospora parathelypteridis TaxID=1839617 RepID=A0A840W7R4_9ACTN|nr:hypothetical protein [Micromonospora parathelypteridis]MBB5479111.1 hypothetical protein [Micromonospora parathelypteridis]GGO03013.1 hypothetical protein GCM10011576_02890 [Micromonospora parathelypteridis]
MNIRRWSFGFLAATLLVPGLAACKSDAAEPAAGTGASPSAPAVPADPKEALLASTKEMAKGDFTFTLAGAEMTGGGLVHKPSNSAQVTVKFGDASQDMSIEMDLVYIDSESWVKMDLGGAMVAALPGAAKNKGKYQHLDKTKVEGIADLQLDPESLDPVDSDALVKGVTDVQKTAEGAYAGKIDISAAATESLALDEEVVTALGAQAKALPFTAKLDPQGRLTELVISVPAAGETAAHEVKISYTGYGTGTGAKKPPADKVVEAPAETYEMFK